MPILGQIWPFWAKNPNTFGRKQKFWFFEQLFPVVARKWLESRSGFWPENGSYPKKSPKMTFPPLIIWAKATFFFEQLFPVVARTWFPLRSGFFWGGPISRFLAQKSNFCHTTPILVNGPFVAVGKTVHFPPWEQFFDFPFRSYSCFRKKKSG